MVTPVGAGTGVPGSRRMARLGSVRARASSNPFSTSSKATSPFAEKPSTRRRTTQNRKRLDDEEEDPNALLDALERRVRWSDVSRGERERARRRLLSIASRLEPSRDTPDLDAAPVWTVPPDLSAGAPITPDLYPRTVSLDELFPGTGLGAAFNSDAEFRAALRAAMRYDLFVPDPKLSDEQNAQLRSKGSTCHVVWKDRSTDFPRLTEALRRRGLESITGGDFVLTLGSLCGGEATSGSLLEIVNNAAGGRDRVLVHSWHQDSGRQQRTVMLGFPPKSGFEGTGVFSHCVKLSHELKPQGRRGEVVQFELYDPRPREIPEEYVIRPVYKEGAEVLVYHDNAVLHSTPDYIDREAVWRFM